MARAEFQERGRPYNNLSADHSLLACKHKFYLHINDGDNSSQACISLDVADARELAHFILNETETAN